MIEIILYVVATLAILGFIIGVILGFCPCKDIFTELRHESIGMTMIIISGIICAILSVLFRLL